MSNLDPILNSYAFSPNNLFGLLARYRVIVPGIQRHYVQGADNLHAKEVRERFVRDILKSIKERSPLCLDFIYGPIETAGADAFTPVDGQQRLTTVWLAVRYFAETLADEVRLPVLSLLSRFSYEDRIHATRFCHELTATKNRFGHECSPSEAILRKEWFTPYWIKDSTVSAMLNTLDTIHDVCTKEFHNPIDPCQALEHIGTRLTFQLCVDSFGQDIYMKMNARGLTLTQWENFKGRFAKLLDDTDGEKWEKPIEKFSNWFFVAINKSRLPDDPFLALIARILVYAVASFQEETCGPQIKRMADHSNWGQELPYVPFSEIEQLACSLQKRGMLAGCVNGFLILLDYLLPPCDKASNLRTIPTPYWQRDKKLLNVVFLPENENERHFSLMLFEYFKKHNKANGDSFARAVRYMWNILENVSIDIKDAYIRVHEAAKGFGQADAYSGLESADRSFFTSAAPQYWEELAKAQLYAAGGQEKIKLLNSAEELMHGRVRLGVLGLNKEDAPPVQMIEDRLNALVTLLNCYLSTDDEGTRKRLNLLVVAAEPLNLQDDIALSATPDNLRSLLSTRDDKFLQKSLIDWLIGRKAEKAIPDDALEANPCKFDRGTSYWKRDWRKSILSLADMQPDSLWGNSVAWHRSGDYYLYCGKNIRNALPISDWRFDLQSCERYKCYVESGDIYMNDGETRSVRFPSQNPDGFMIYFWRHQIGLRKDGKSKQIPIDTTDVAKILGTLEESCQNWGNVSEQ